jgi:hypothetical protein
LTYTHIIRILVAYRQSTSDTREPEIIRQQWEELELTLSKMTVEELLELRALVDTNIDTAELQARRIELGLEEPEEEPAAENGAGEKSKASKGGGYVELKMINGCGPYAYKRARVGGRLTSEYIGKVKQ